MRRNRTSVLYQVADRLHQGRAVRVTSDGIGAAVSGSLADLDVASPRVDELAAAVRSGDWVVAHALEDLLAADVTIAA